VVTYLLAGGGLIEASKDGAPGRMVLGSDSDSHVTAVGVRGQDPGKDPTLM